MRQRTPINNNAPPAPSGDYNNSRYCVILCSKTPANNTTKLRLYWKVRRFCTSLTPETFLAILSANSFSSAVSTFPRRVTMPLMQLTPIFVALRPGSLPIAFRIFRSVSTSAVTSVETGAEGALTVLQPASVNAATKRLTTRIFIYIFIYSHPLRKY